MEGMEGNHADYLGWRTDVYTERGYTEAVSKFLTIWRNRMAACDKNLSAKTVVKLFSLHVGHQKMLCEDDGSADLEKKNFNCFDSL